MRSLFIILLYLIVLIISLPLYLVAFILGKIHPRKMHMFVQKFVAIVFRIALFISGTDYNVVGLENIPKDQPVVYVANHRSIFDVAITYSVVPGPTCYIAKKEIKKAIGIAQWMYFLKCFFLDRDDIRTGLNMILFSIERIKEGYSIYISPEGTRNQGDSILPFKEGSLKMVQKTGCLMIPVVVNNTENIFENHFPWIKKAKVWVEFGPPIDIKQLDGNDKKFIAAYVRDEIEKIYIKNKANI